MRRPALLSLLALATLAVTAASAAPPPPPPPVPAPSFQGRDQVLIGRLYWREAGQTQPLTRFGMVLAGKAGTQTVTAKDTPAGAVSLSLTARRTGGADTEVTWSLLPGARVTAAQGRALVREGSVGHCPIGKAGEGELFVSLETGRANTFNVQRLWEHFGVVTDAQRFAAAREAAPAAAPGRMPAAAAPVAAAPRGTRFTVSCGSGRRFELSTGTSQGRCETTVDGDRITGGACDDDAGNSARVSCTLNDGDGSCVSATGAGSCLLVE